MGNDALGLLNLQILLFSLTIECRCTIQITTFFFFSVITKHSARCENKGAQKQCFPPLCDLIPSTHEQENHFLSSYLVKYRPDRETERERERERERES